jgi:hypothetical protein
MRDGIPIEKVYTLPKTNQLSRTSHKNNTNLDLAIATISNASVEEIFEALKKVPQDSTAKIAIAIGKVWQESDAEC